VLQLIGYFMDESIRLLLDDRQQSLLLLVSQGWLSPTLGKGGFVTTFLAKLLPDTPNPRFAGAKLLGDVHRVPAALIQPNDLSSLPLAESLHAIAPFILMTRSLHKSSGGRYRKMRVALASWRRLHCAPLQSCADA
jgi:hypothetical protein